MFTHNNPNLDNILASAQQGKIHLSNYTFLEPIAIAHLSVLCKQLPQLLEQSSIAGNATSYLSRLNFYEYIGVRDNFGNNIYYGNNLKTIEINEANNVNQQAYDQVQTILQRESLETRDIMEGLLSELIGNTESYATFGVVTGQVIMRTLHLCVVDKGPGIATHLKSHLPEYQSLNDSDVILESLKKGVTCGRGMGYGLWQTFEVLKRNGGLFIIRSGNQIVDALTGKCYTTPLTWLGTSIELRYNLDNKVDFNEILASQNIGVIDDFGF